MSFFNKINFFKSTSSSQHLKSLKAKVKAHFEKYDVVKTDERLALLTSVIGLMTRVAYADLQIDESEKAFIESALRDKLSLSEQDAAILVQIGVEHVEELAGLDNHLYALELRDRLGERDKVKLVELLFLLAAVDGAVENIESEDIRIITESLRLSPKHFLSARAKVADSLKLMKK